MHFTGNVRNAENKRKTRSKATNSINAVDTYLHCKLLEPFAR